MQGMMGRQHKASSERSQPSGGHSNRNRISSSSSRSRGFDRGRSRTPTPNSSWRASKRIDRRRNRDPEVGSGRERTRKDYWSADIVRGRNSWGAKKHRDGITIPSKFCTQDRSKKSDKRRSSDTEVGSRKEHTQKDHWSTDIVRGSSSWGARKHRDGITIPCKSSTQGQSLSSPNRHYLHENARGSEIGGDAPKVAVSQLPQLLTPIPASAGSINNDMVHDSEGKGRPSTIGNQSTQTGTHAANPPAVENLGKTAEGSQQENHQVPGEMALQDTIHFSNAPKSSFALNTSQVHGGQCFNPSGEFLQDPPIKICAESEKSQASIDLNKPYQDDGAESMYNSLPAEYPDVQTHVQSLQEVSTGPSYMPLTGQVIGAPVPPTLTATDHIAYPAFTYFTHVISNPTGLAVLQQPQPNMNSMFIGAPPSAGATDPRLWAQNPPGMMIQQAPFVPAVNQLQVTMNVGSSYGNPENKAGEDRCINNAGEVDMKNMILNGFKHALADFVIGQFRPTYERLQLGKELHRTIVRQVVHRVVDLVEIVPDTKQKMNDFITYGRETILKILEECVGAVINGI